MSKKNKNRSKSNNSLQQNKQKNYKKVESYVCERCDSQCVEYEKYIERLDNLGKVGFGVLCKKV